MIDPYVSFWFGSAWAVHLLVCMCIAVGNTRFRLQSSTLIIGELERRAALSASSVPNIVLVMERVQP